MITILTILAIALAAILLVSTLVFGLGGILLTLFGDVIIAVVVIVLVVKLIKKRKG